MLTAATRKSIDPVVGCLPSSPNLEIAGSHCTYRRKPRRRSQSDASTRTWCSHAHQASATSPDTPNRHPRVCHRAEPPTDTQKALASPHQQAPRHHQHPCPSKSKGVASGSSSLVVITSLASFSLSGSGFVPALTRYPPRLVPSFATEVSLTVKI